MSAKSYVLFLESNHFAEKLSAIRWLSIFVNLFDFWLSFNCGRTEIEKESKKPFAPHLYIEIKESIDFKTFDIFTIKFNKKSNEAFFTLSRDNPKSCSLHNFLLCFGNLSRTNSPILTWHSVHFLPSFCFQFFERLEYFCFVFSRN